MIMVLFKAIIISLLILTGLFFYDYVINFPPKY